MGNNEVNKILDLYDLKKFKELRRLGINIDFESLESKEDLADMIRHEEVPRYTAKELKIIHYMFTGDRSQYIMNATNKGILIDGVRDILIDYRRSKKLLGNT